MKFILPLITIVQRDYIGKHQNNPLNLEFCKEIISHNEPDGYGSIYPIIEFKGCGVKWYYPKNNYKLRDTQYEKIIENIVSYQ